MDNERMRGEIMARTVDERITELEVTIARLSLARDRDDHLTKTAAGLLRKVRNAGTLEEVKEILLQVAGVLDASGRGGGR